MNEHTFIHAHMHTSLYKKLLLLWWFPLKAVLMYSVKCMSETLKSYQPAVVGQVANVCDVRPEAMTSDVSE